jgi:hypothetical protein
VPVPVTALPAQLVKGRQTPVTAFKTGAPGPADSPGTAGEPVLADGQVDPGQDDAGQQHYGQDNVGQDDAGQLATAGVPPAERPTLSTDAPPDDTQDETAGPAAAAAGPGTAQLPPQTQGIRTWKLWKVLRQNAPR